MSKISDTHPELFHYTTAAGLAGILENNSLWATHASFVNDEEETLCFYHRILPLILRPIFLQLIEESKAKPAFQKALGDKTVEDFCEEQFAQIMDAIRTTAATMYDHYITSFSAPSNDWVRENGLLSQWRAYGQDGGYAIVFDTSTFDEILSTETTPYQEEIFSWADVQYYVDKGRRTGDPDTDKRIEELEIAAKRFFRSGSENDAGNLSTPLTILSSIFKHRGFEEENEVRLVLSLFGPRLESLPETRSMRQHPVKTRIRMGEAVPYVELLARDVNGLRQRLPINRIIVGPHRDKNGRKRAVQLLLKQHGLNPEMVTVSDIPYRGW